MWFKYIQRWCHKILVLLRSNCLLLDLLDLSITSAVQRQRLLRATKYWAKITMPQQAVWLISRCRGGSIVMGVPPNGWFIMEKPFKWMIGGYPYFRKPPWMCYVENRGSCLLMQSPVEIQTQNPGWCFQPHVNFPISTPLLSLGVSTTLWNKMGRKTVKLPIKHWHLTQKHDASWRCVYTDHMYTSTTRLWGWTYAWKWSPLIQESNHPRPKENRNSDIFSFFSV